MKTRSLPWRFASYRAASALRKSESSSEAERGYVPQEERDKLRIQQLSPRRRELVGQREVQA